MEALVLDLFVSCNSQHQGSGFSLRVQVLEGFCFMCCPFSQHCMSRGVFSSSVLGAALLLLKGLSCACGGMYVSIRAAASVD